MSTADWPPLEAQTIPLPTIVSSSDLFDGELFGDELIDIYNSSVGVSDSHHAEEDFKKSDLPSEDVLTALDDGFADFHGSNTFNDLASFITPPSDCQEVSTMPPLPLSSVESTIPTATTAPTVAVQVTVTVPNSIPPSPALLVKSEAVPVQTKASKKRASDGQPSAAPKKKTATARRNSTTKKSNQNTKALTTNAPTVVPSTAKSSAFLKTADSTAEPKGPDPAKETPNPLTLAHLTSGDTKKPKLVISKKGGVQHNVKAVVQAPTPIAVTSASAHNTNLPSNTAALQSFSVSPATSAHDFKNLAQAAVSDLITNLSVKSQDTKTVNDVIKVNTSTAHIKALTGTNWVSSSSSTTSVGGLLSISDSNIAEPTGNSENQETCDAKSTDSTNNNGSSRCKRQNLTADERARQNRDRNREHARNTRLRKKAYVEELKHTLTELVSQRDSIELEKRQSAQRELEQREVRFRVIEEFLKLRGRNETNFARWAAILEEDFVLTVPWLDVNQLRNGTAIASSERTSSGVSNAMAESKSFSILLQTMNQGKDATSFQFTCDRKDFFMDNCNAVLEWSGIAVDSVGKIDTSVISLKGIVRAKFSPASNKLLSLAMIFDTSMIVHHCQKVNSIAFNTVCETSYDVIAAQVAASQANAIIDSIQMPCMSVEVPSAVNFVHASSSSEASSEKCELDSDESISGHSEKASFVSRPIVIPRAS